MASSTFQCPPSIGICAHAIILHSRHSQFSRNRAIVVEENRKRYIINNTNGECIAKVRVDNGILSSTSDSKSDYMIIRCQHDIVYLIELKGSDVKKACEQVLSTIEKLAAILQAATIHARIICSRVPTPALRSSQYNKLYLHCQAKNGQLIIRVNQFEENYTLP